MNSVLIIDDEPDLLDLLELTLLKMGLSAVKAGSVRMHRRGWRRATTRFA
jgi:DNA-binding NtrC family response regulator